MPCICNSNFADCILLRLSFSLSLSTKDSPENRLKTCSPMKTNCPRRFVSTWLHPTASARGIANLIIQFPSTTDIWTRKWLSNTSKFIFPFQKSFTSSTRRKSRAFSMQDSESTETGHRYELNVALWHLLPFHYLQDILSSQLSLS